VSKKSKRRDDKKDPYHQREAEKYENPVASREFILHILEDFGRPMSRTQLLAALKIEEESQQESLGFRLRAMLRDGQVMQDRRGRYCLFNKINLKHGTIQGHPDGFGFFIPTDKSEDMMLSSKEMRLVMHGDVVLAYQSGVDRRGRPEGKIHEVIEHANASVVGRFFSEQDMGFVTPDSKHLTQKISIPKEKTNNAKNGQIVLVEMLSYPTKHTPAVSAAFEMRMYPASVFLFSMSDAGIFFMLM